MIKHQVKKLLPTLTNLNISKKELSQIDLEINNLIKEFEKMYGAKINEEKLKLVLDSTASGIYTVDENGLCTYVNRSTLKMLGYKEEKDFIGKNMHKMVHHSYSDGTTYPSEDCSLLKAYKAGTVIEEEGIIWKKDGTFFSVVYVSSPQIKYGEIVGTVVSFRDITEKIRFRDQLKIEHDQSQKYLDVAGVMMMVLDKDGNVKLMNKKGCQILEVEEQDIIGKNWLDNYVPKEKLSTVRSLFADIFKEGADVQNQYESEIVTATGKTKIIARNNVLLYDSENKITGILSSGEDITEKIRYRDQLKIERDQSQNYLDVAGVMILVLDSDGNVKLMNKKGCQILEVEEKDIVGKNWFDCFVPKDQVPAVKILFADVFKEETKIQEQYESEVITTTGKTKMITWNNVVLYDSENKAIGVLSSGEDLSEKKRYEEELRQSNKRFETLFEKAPIGYQSLDIEGCFREVNHTWLEMLGYQKEEVIGKWFGDFLAPDYQEHFKKRFEKFKQKGKIHSEFEMIHKDGHKLFVAFNGLIGYDDNNEFQQTFCNLNDITSEREMQKQLFLSENNLKLAQRIAKIGSWEIDITDGSMWASEEAFKIYDLDRTDGNVDVDLVQQMVNHEDRKKLDIALDELINMQIPYNVTFKILTRSNDIKYLNSRASLFMDEHDKPEKVVGVIHDITELKIKEIELEYLSQRDHLTNLYNRRYYFKRFKELDNSKYYPIGVMMLDMNGLKIINDAYGHSFGDLALQKFSNLLFETFENKDIVSRFGGDEFTVLIPNTTAERLDKYKKELSRKVKLIRIENVELSVAIGYEIKNSMYQSIDEIQKLAENLMYRHKTTIGSSVRSNAINAILNTLVDKYTTERNHSIKVSHLCKQMGKVLELGEDEVRELEQAGLFHDIGKISLPDDILDKPGKLTNEEYEVIKGHPEVGYQILRAADEYSDLAVHALHHHERWDGEGYPTKMRRDNIPLFSRIICIADAYEAMTADRPYRKKMSKEYAVSEIIRCAGTQFDPNLAKIFVEKVLLKEFK